MEETAVYLYCITDARVAAEVGTLGIKGMDGCSHLFPVIYKDICGVTSSVPLSEFGETVLDKNFQNMHWLEKKALLHENILEQIMDIYPIIPMRFCTIYNSDDRIREVLEEHYEKFLTILRFLEDKEEWGVKIFCDAGVLEKEVVKSSDKVRKIETEIAGNSSGKAFFLKKKLAGLIKEEVEARSFAYADECYTRLARIAENSCLNKLLDKEVTGNAGEMLLNSAYLVTRGKVEEFRQEVALLEQEYGPSGLEFAVTGPWPPYHFCRSGLDGRDNDE